MFPQSSSCFQKYKRGLFCTCPFEVASVYHLGEIDVLVTSFVMAATRWRDGTSGQHVEYDQRPDVFRYAVSSLLN
jgi:hypothetical protein